MSMIRKIGEYVDIMDIAKELEDAPQLWNQNTFRTEFATSPHREVDDIWVRYNALENFDKSNPLKFNAEHESVWLPAASMLQNVVSVSVMMAAHYGGKLGGVLITRIPPWKCVYPHKDGGWHAGYYDKKIGICVQANENQEFCFAGESLISKTGDIFEFDNSKTHWVNNNSDQPRITVIAAIRSREQ